jgi:hypothetical protein
MHRRMVVANSVHASTGSALSLIGPIYNASSLNGVIQSCAQNETRVENIQR